MNFRWVKPLPTSGSGGHRDNTGERLLKLALGGLLAGLALPSCQPGERASNDGQCPPGEICSDWTPEGLLFIGARTFNNAADQGLLATAVEGKQTISARLAGEAELPPYVAGFDAKLVDSTVVAVSSSTPTAVVLHGEAEGTALLRLLQPGTNKLLDRVETTAAPVARMALLPRELRDQDQAIPRWAVLAGGSPALGVLLFDQNDDQLVDEALEVTAHTVEVARQGWDLYAFTAPSAGPLWLTVRAGGRSFAAAVPIAPSVDDIQSRAAGGEPIAVKLGASATTVCFVAMSTGAAVAGATWSFEPAAGISVARPQLPELQRWAPPGCVAITGQTLGPTTLTAVASDYRKTFALVVEPQPQ